jgi:hypothetical protein
MSLFVSRSIAVLAGGCLAVVAISDLAISDFRGDDDDQLHDDDG